MPITAEKKQLLVEIVKDLTDIERVWIAGALYDSFIAAGLPWADLHIISQCMSDRITWNLLPARFDNPDNPAVLERLKKVQVMIVRSIDEVLLKKLPELLGKQTPEARQLVADVIKDIDGVELVRIAGAAYNSFVAAELSQDKSVAISKFMFAKVEFFRLPEGLRNQQAAIIKGVKDKLLDALPELIETIVVEPSAEAPASEAPATEGPQDATSGDVVPAQASITFQEISPVTSPTSITITTTTPPITPATRSEIDELDESASMHGMDTELPPEGGEVAQEEVRVDATEEDLLAAVEEEPVVDEEEEELEEEGVSSTPEDDDLAEENSALPEGAASRDSNGHKADVVPETEVEQKPEAEVEQKPEAEVEQKPEVMTEQKVETKTGQKPERWSRRER